MTVMRSDGAVIDVIIIVDVGLIDKRAHVGDDVVDARVECVNALLHLCVLYLCSLCE